MPKYKVEMENCSKVRIDGVELPVVVTYLRGRTPKIPATSEVKQRGRPFGAIVAVDKDHIGWSLCYKHDSWNRKRAIEIAAGRAMRGTDYWLGLFENYTSENHFYGVRKEIGDVSLSGLPKLNAVLDGMKEMEVRMRTPRE